MKSIITYLLFFLFILTIQAQNGNVGINSDGSPPDANAILDVKSTTKGMLIPRMSTVQRSILGNNNPTPGLLVFDIETESFWFYETNGWIELMAGSKDDADADPMNELIQSVQLNGNNLEVMDAGGTKTVDLSGLETEDTDWTETTSVVYTPKNVGIGVVSPDPNAKLEINQDSDVRLKLKSNSFDDGKSSIFFSNKNNAQLGTDFIIEAINENGLFFRTDSDLSQNTTDNILVLAPDGDIGIGTDVPNADAILDINSTSKGILIPRMTTIQKENIPTPPNGLLVYDLSTNSFWYYANEWKELLNEKEREIKRTAIPGIVFTPTRDVNYRGGHGQGVYIFSEENLSLVAPVFLPDNAILRSITYYYKDNSNSNFSMGLNVQNFGINYSIYGDFLTSGNENTIKNETIITSPLVIDNDGGGYYLSINNASGFWDGFNFVLYGVTIEYLE